MTTKNTITYGSVCSGIEAASVAWEVLAFSPAWFAEIEAFPSAVLACHWPEVSNQGDMTQLAAKVRAGEADAPDILVGGTPCQAFSVAGARAGLADPRGQLTIAYVELADAIDEQRAKQGKPPVIIVWENVPGVLSSKDNAFGAFLGLLAGEDCELQPPGKRWTNAGCVLRNKRAVAWRILDAQYFGVAQRRRRVFVIASARTDIDPTQILFESDGVRRDTAPSRGAGKAVAALTARGVGTCGADDNQGQAGHLIPISTSTWPVSHCLNAGGMGRIDYETETMVVHGTQDPDTNVDLAHTLGRNHGQENAVISFSSKDSGQDATTELSPTVRAAGNSKSHANAGAPPAVAYSLQHAQIGHKDTAGPQGKGWQEEVGFTLDSRPDADAVAVACVAKGAQGIIGGQHPKAAVETELCPTLTEAMGTGGGHIPVTHSSMSVRRLTPIECERLQGFPDNHTLIPVDKRKQITAEEYAYLRHHNPLLTAEQAYKLAADGPRYKAIGNSMAVPVMRWIGSRIYDAIHAASVAETATN